MKYYRQIIPRYLQNMSEPQAKCTLMIEGVLDFTNPTFRKQFGIVNGLISLINYFFQKLVKLPVVTRKVFFRSERHVTNEK